MVALLHPDVEWTGDGGGRRAAATLPLTGRDAVVAQGLWRKAPDQTRVEPGRVNASAAAQVYLEDELDTVIGIDVREGLIARFWAMRNPEKLRYLANQLATS